MHKNEWEKLATDAPIIQDAKNKVLNDKLLEIIENIGKENLNLNIFDYGCGWGEWVNQLSQKGYESEAYDEADEMVDQAILKFGNETKFFKREEFKKSLEKFKNKYDIVTSNLVLCILEREMQIEMLNNIKSILKDDGKIVISFCHPCFDYISESVVSVRKSPDGARYDREFEYEKEIKENGITFHDLHRPLSYYSKLFKESDLSILEIAESEILDTAFYPDFITFVLKKK
ncbi:MAG: methyltransferase type 11 [uncultured bacterium]|nr:MAG: methyltransferase type 11 [uncultured bacterium]